MMARIDSSDLNWLSAGVAGCHGAGAVGNGSIGQGRLVLLESMETRAEVAVPTKDIVCAELARMQPSLAARGVSSLALFGSVARGEARGDSDIDVAIKTKGKFGLIALAGVKMHLEECMGRNVDVVFIEGLSPIRRESVLRDLIPIF